MSTFNDLSLPLPIQKSLDQLGFTIPTPIQIAAIPLAMQNRDLIACAQTGTGKTAAFSIPLIAKILKKPTAKVLVVTPTRELATQIQTVIFQLTSFSSHIRSVVLIGGASMGRQMRDLQKNPSVVIGTPGRLIDHMQRRSINFLNFETIVLDEADRMFDMGFSESMKKIFNALSADRQTLLFSATFSKEVEGLAKAFLRSPERISLGAIDRPLPKIKQVKLSVEGAEKNDIIMREVQARTGQVLIFCRTKIRTDRLGKFLKKNGVKAASIHGGRTQSQREQALQAFRDGQYAVLVATDVASRGLDIPDIQTVFNFDLPEVKEDYIHRIGRTARAGAEGEAVSLVTREEERHWAYLSRENSETQGRRQLKSAKTFAGKNKFFSQHKRSFSGFFKKKSGFNSKRSQRRAS